MGKTVQQTWYDAYEHRSYQKEGMLNCSQAVVEVREERIIEECGRAEASEVRRNVSPRVEGREVKGVLILSGKTFY